MIKTKIENQELLKHLETVCEDSKDVFLLQEGEASGIENYRQLLGMTEENLWDNLKYFLERIIPVAAECDVNMAIHEDDPCWSIFGLPRIITNEKNLDRFLRIVDVPNNGITLCTGSLGCSGHNDVVRMAAKYTAMGRIHFVHMRNVAVLPGGFEERAHPSFCGTLDMYAIMKALFDNGFRGYIRPDHGRMIWGETGRPGYGLYDRALGASYLTGLWEAIEKGNALEPVMFELFKILYGNRYEVIDTKNISLSSKQFPYMRANLDGALINKSNGQKGVLEIKSSTIQNASMLKRWRKDDLPITYYFQVLHYLYVTGFDFAIVYAILDIPWANRQETRVVEMYREDLEEDMEFLIKTERWFWNKVVTNTPPPFLEKRNKFLMN